MQTHEQRKDTSAQMEGLKKTTTKETTLLETVKEDITFHVNDLF